MIAGSEPLNRLHERLVFDYGNFVVHHCFKSRTLWRSGNCRNQAITLIDAAGGGMAKSNPVEPSARLATRLEEAGERFRNFPTF